MRFLQMEWHNHERARNAWDIERAEMKAKIAKQEGETRSAKKLNESLDRQIRMLERVLKAERAKAKALASGEQDTASVDKSQQASDVQPMMNGKGIFGTLHCSSDSGFDIGRSEQTTRTSRRHANRNHDTTRRGTRST